MAGSRSIGVTVIIVLFFGAFAAFGGMGLFIVGQGAYYGYASKSWPSTEGVIDESRIKTRKGKKDKKKHSLVIRYHYSVDGVRHANDKAQFLDNVFSPKTKKEEIAATFRSGQPARVYYHPSDPRVSVLIPGFPLVTFLGALFVSLLFLILGLWGLILLRK